MEWQVETLVSVLRKYKKSIGLIILDIIKILLGICTQKIQLEKDFIPTIEHQQ